jgi:uncharacterized protein (TIGR02099 family)
VCRNIGKRSARRTQNPASVPGSRREARAARASMKPIRAFFRFSRRATLWLSALAGALALAFAALLFTTYVWLLPNIDRYRDTLAAILSHALGQKVTVEAISGRWQRARPEVHLRGIQVYDRQNRPALFLDAIDAVFAWRTLLFLEPRFNRLELTGSAFAVRRARDGHYYVGGIPINPADPNSDFSDWLLRQGEVHLRHATIAWQDAVRGAPPVVLRDVDFSLENHFHRHLLTLAATPPPHLATPVALRADLNGRSTSDLRTWSGTVEGSVAGIDVAQLGHWVDLPYPVSHGWGAANVRLEIARGALTGILAGVNARELTVAIGPRGAPIALTRLQGQLGWRQDGERRKIEARNLAFTLANLDVPAFDASFAWDARTRELGARNLDLAAVRPVLMLLPVPQRLDEAVRDLQPGGRIDTLALRWQGEWPGAADFDVAARVSGLSFLARGARPGVDNLSATLRGNQKAGVFELGGKDMALILPAVFRDPRLPLASLAARGGWKKTARGTLFTVQQADFANADAAGSLHGSFEAVPGRPGFIDLAARLTRGTGTAVYRYLPRVVGDATVAWVKRAVVAGSSNDTTLTLRGDLARFPFADDAGGVFRVDVRIQDGVLDYAEGWPRIEGADAELVFHGKSLTVRSERARIFNAQLGSVVATIPDLEAADELLEVRGRAEGPAADFIRFANFSPVGEMLDGLTDEMDGSGPLTLALNMKIPLRHAHDTTLGGRLGFHGNTIFPAALPRLERVTGDIVFSESSVSSENLGAQFLGGPLAMTIATRDGRATIGLTGRATAAGLLPWLGKTWGERLAGEAAWHGQVVLQKGRSAVRVESDLVGLESRLPAPLAKPARQPLPLRVARQPQPDKGQILEVEFGTALAALWQTTPEGRVARGEIHFGGPARLPQEPGLRLAGNGRGISLSEWMSLLPRGSDDSGLPISAIDLNFDSVDLIGRRFSDVTLQGRTRGGLLRVAVNGRDMNGVLTYRPEGAAPARLSAQFKQLVIPAAGSGSADTEGARLRAIEVPSLDLAVEDFRLEDRALGRLEAVAHGAPQGLVIDSLQLIHADSVLRMNGVWHDVGKPETRANLEVDIQDVGRMLARFGFKDAVKRGSAEIRGDVTWEGSPADFGFRTLAGTLRLKAKNGQFLKVDPGAAKLLGVLSLQSLPRRLTFDFRDLFSDGFAFDEISATMRIARGIVYSDDFLMKGPAAKVNMSGMANLNDETVQLRVKVYPKLSEGVAVAGALLGGPVAGLGALAAQKLLRDPLEAASSQEYMVTGPWREPDVSKLSKPKHQEPSGDGNG